MLLNIEYNGRIIYVGNGCIQDHIDMKYCPDYESYEGTDKSPNCTFCVHWMYWLPKPRCRIWQNELRRRIDKKLRIAREHKDQTKLL